MVSQDMATLNMHFGNIMDNPHKAPVTFVYGGTKYCGIAESFNPVTTVKTQSDEKIVREAIGIDSATGLRVTITTTQYLKHPACEWVAAFTNIGAKPTQMLSDIQAVDMRFPGEEPVLWHCNGDYYSKDGYIPSKTPMVGGAKLRFAPSGGRSCDQAFPYYRLLFHDYGISLAIGWPAQWAASFSAEDGIALIAGQEHIHCVLQPGETVVSPSFNFVCYAGDEQYGINVWRRWFRDCVMPKQNGKPIPPKHTMTYGGGGEEFTKATEENQICAINERLDKGLKPDLWWIDAGWYPCLKDDGVPSWPKTGSWFADTARFPNGLKPVGDLLKKNGIDLLLWFEPERVKENTWLFDNHREWLLSKKPSENDYFKESPNYLLDLGNSACLNWLIDHVDELIKEYQLSCYRQDFNFEPLNYWRENDEPDRQGMHENLHTQGYLAYWDALLARNPHLFIDSCASGGRRNDIETMRRSVPLHHTDYGYGNHPIKLAFHRTLCEWIPYFRSMVFSWEKPDGSYYMNSLPERFIIGRFDEFSFYCAMAPMIHTCDDFGEVENPVPMINKMIPIWRSIAKFMIDGDYYPLTPFSTERNAIFAWQFHKPELNSGFLQVIRHNNCPQEQFIAPLRGLLPDCTFELKQAETGECIKLTGSELAKGFAVNLPIRSGVIYCYKPC